MSNPLTRGRFIAPVCQIRPTQIHRDHADLYALLARKQELEARIASLNKRIAFELARLQPALQNHADH